MLRWLAARRIKHLNIDLDRHRTLYGEQVVEILDMMKEWRYRDEIMPSVDGECPNVSARALLRTDCRAYRMLALDREHLTQKQLTSRAARYPMLIVSPIVVNVKYERAVIGKPYVGCAPLAGVLFGT